MGFMDALRRIFGGGTGTPSESGDPHGLWYHFRCGRCGSVVRIRADRRNDLNREEGPCTYILRKDVMDNTCFQLMRAELWLDDSYNVVTSEVSGGKLISQEEYEEATEKA